MRRPGVYEDLKNIGVTLLQGISERLQVRGLHHQILGEPMLFDVIFSDKPVSNYRDVLAANVEANTIYNDVLRQNGILKAPGKMYPSLALSEDDIEKTLQAVDLAAEAVAKSM